jgi:hypothetical protein
VGFWLSAVIQAVVLKEEMSQLLPNDSPKTIALACGLVVLLLRCRCAGALDLPQRRELYGDGP